MTTTITTQPKESVVNVIGQDNVLCVIAIQAGGEFEFRVSKDVTAQSDWAEIHKAVADVAHHLRELQKVANKHRQ